MLENLGSHVLVRARLASHEERVVVQLRVHLLDVLGGFRLGLGGEIGRREANVVVFFPRGLAGRGDVEHLGEAKVGNLGDSVAGEQDVGGLEVAVDDGVGSPGVHVVERRRDVARDLERAVKVHLLAPALQLEQLLLQRPAAHQLANHDRRLPSLVPHAQELHDVRVHQPAPDGHLAVELLQRDGVRHAVALERLDRHGRPSPAAASNLPKRPLAHHVVNLDVPRQQLPLRRAVREEVHALGHRSLQGVARSFELGVGGRRLTLTLTLLLRGGDVRGVELVDDGLEPSLVPLRDGFLVGGVVVVVVVGVVVGVVLGSLHLLLRLEGFGERLVGSRGRLGGRRLRPPRRRLGGGYLRRRRLLYPRRRPDEIVGVHGDRAVLPRVLRVSLARYGGSRRVHPREVGERRATPAPVWCGLGLCEHPRLSVPGTPLANFIGLGAGGGPRRGLDGLSPVSVPVDVRPVPGAGGEQVPDSVLVARLCGFVERGPGPVIGGVDVDAHLGDEVREDLHAPVRGGDVQCGGTAGVPGVDAHQVDGVLADARQERREVVNLGVLEHHRHARSLLQHGARQRLRVPHHQLLHRAALIAHGDHVRARILALQGGDVLRQRPRVCALGVDVHLEALLGDGQLGLVVLDDGAPPSSPRGAPAGEAPLHVTAERGRRVRFVGGDHVHGSLAVGAEANLDRGGLLGERLLGVAVRRGPVEVAAVGPVVTIPVFPRLVAAFHVNESLLLCVESAGRGRGSAGRVGRVGRVGHAEITRQIDRGVLTVRTRARSREMKGLRRTRELHHVILK